AGPQAWLNRCVLGSRPLVGIGLISYPLYLWHWPLLSFLQIAEGGAPTTGQKAIAVLAAFVLAAATYWLLERPIRRSLGWHTPVKIAALAASLVVVGGVMAYARATNALTARAPNLIVGFYSRVEEPGLDPSCAARFPTKGEYCTVYPSGLPVTTALI